VLPDKSKADYVLCDRQGRALAVIEARKAAINPAVARRWRFQDEKRITITTLQSVVNIHHEHSSSH
jgi:type I site-specific restriction endonuclease